MKIVGSNVLVTGGAGFIGSHVVDQLIKKSPKSITVVDNFFLGREANLYLASEMFSSLEVIRLDASNLSAMRDICKVRNIDYVFDLAVVPLPTSLKYPNWTIQTNIGIVNTFCELMRVEAIEELIHISSSEAYGSARYVPMDEEHPHDAITPYAASKSAGDHIIQSYVKTFGCEIKTIRPFNNFGPRQNLGSYAGVIPIVIKNVLDRKPIEIHGSGEQTRDFIFAPTTADLILKIAESEKTSQEVINLATGHETKIIDLVKDILEIMDASQHPLKYTEPRPGDVFRHCADTTKLKRLLGVTPEAMQMHQLEDTVKYYLEVLRND